MPSRGKRGNLHLRQRGKKGTWYAYYYDADGKKIGKSLGTTSKVEANAKLKELQAQVTIAKARRNLTWEEQEIQTYGYLPEEAYESQLKELLKSDMAQKIQKELEAEWVRKKRADAAQSEEERKQYNPKVEDFWPVFIEIYSKIRRPNTITQYNNAWKKLLATTKPKRLGDITPASMRKFFRGCAAQGLGEMTARNYATAIQGIINKAIDSDLYRGEKLQLPKDALPAKMSTRRVRIPTEEERDTLLSASEDDADFYAFMMLVSFAGLRRQEAIALEWEDVDFNHSKIQVKDKPKWNIMAKSKAGNRSIEMAEELKQYLLPIQQDSGPIVRPQHGRVRAYDVMGTKFNKVRAQTDLNWCRIHDLRHTFGSLLLLRGTPVLYVSRWMGHSSSQITQDIYGHLIEDGAEHINKLSSNGGDDDAISLG